jgi:hypothetical protein
MKKNITICILFVVLTLTAFSQTEEKILQAREVIKNRGEVEIIFDRPEWLTISFLSKNLSISKIKDAKIQANVNEWEFDNFLKLQIDFGIVENAQPFLKIATSVADAKDWDSYPTYEQYIQIMNGFATQYPALCKLDTIGFTVDKRLLLAVKISDNVKKKEIEPEFFYTSSIHGNEIPPSVMMLHLIDYLLKNYQKDSLVTKLVNNIEIWINPLANPDGSYRNGDILYSVRRNRNGADLNRNFPDPVDGEHPDGMSWQPETIAMMNFMKKHHFILSANFHTGAEVFNYPWDNWLFGHPDDIWFKNLAIQYVDSIRKHSPTEYFRDPSLTGYTLGSDWYQVGGGRQDYMTYFLRGRENTIEVTYDFIIATSALPNLWEYQYRSLLAYMEQTLFGFSGIITDAVSGLPLKATVEIQNHDAYNSQVYSDSLTGKYYRMVNEGQYDVKFSSPGYEDKLITKVDVKNQKLKVLDVQLKKIFTGITSNSESDKIVYVWPNPAINTVHLTFSVDNKIPYSYELTDMTGRIRFSKNSMTMNQGYYHESIDISSCETGIYILKVKFGNVIQINRIIKQ